MQSVSIEIKSNKELYAQVTAHFVHFQKDGKKPDIEIMQSKNHEQKINVKNERDHIHVINVNNKDWNARSDKSSQNLQEIDTLLETNPDNNTVNNNDELKPTMHPGGISEEVTLTQVLNDKELFDYLVGALELDKKPDLIANPKLMKEVKQMIYRHRKTFLSPNSKLTGSTSLVEMEIEVPPGTRPVHSALRPLHPDLLPDLKSQVEDWVAMGVVQTSKSP